jgi:hypothetical protein
MQLFLMDKMNTGNVLVSQSAVSNTNGGYIWAITFLELTDPLTPFIADASMLTGTNATVIVKINNPTPRKVRSLTHLFLQDSHTKRFTESAFISPYSFQPIDMCGWSISLSDNNALVGCPNRDLSIPNHNGGSSIVFDVNILNVRFSNKTYNVLEGKNYTLSIDRVKPSSEDVLFYVESLDRNAFGSLQTYLSHLYDISVNDIQYPLTIVDGTQLGGKAAGRSQYYGSIHNHSLWVDGEYDYRGISDYVPIKVPFALLIDEFSSRQTIITNPDTILEKPDEYLALVLNSPGFWPSPLGNMFSSLTILDNPSSRLFDGSLMYDKIYYEDSEPMSNIGKALSVDGAANIIVIGSSSTNVTGKLSGGSVVIYGLVFNIWMEVQHLISPEGPADTGLFGDSVSVSTLFAQPLSILAVGEPGMNAVHVYISYNISYGKSYTYEATLRTDLSTSRNDRFGARGTLAIKNGVLFVGAPGLEAVFLFQRMFDNMKNSWVWLYKDMLRSSNFDYDLMYGVPRLHRQEFGSSVSASGRTLVVGSPYSDYAKTGTDLVEVDVDTQGLTIQSYARGKVYVFDIAPEIQLLEILSAAELNTGQFELALNSKGLNEITAPINYYDPINLFESAMTSMSNIDNIIVSSSSQSLGLSGYQYTWTITFISDFEDVPLLAPKWNSSSLGTNRCMKCLPFSSSVTFSVTRLKNLGTWLQSQALHADDRRNGDRFGISVDIDGEQVVVGADKSSAVVTTTWDFEGGSLTG